MQVTIIIFILLLLGAVIIARSPLFFNWQKKSALKLTEEFIRLNMRLHNIRKQKLGLGIESHANELKELKKEETEIIFKLKKMRIKIGERNWRHLVENYSNE